MAQMAPIHGIHSLLTCSSSITDGRPVQTWKCECQPLCSSSSLRYMVEQRGRLDEQTADRNEVKESAWKRNISYGFQCKSTWAMCEMKAEALSAMCGSAPQMWDKYKSPKSRFCHVYMFSSYLFYNYLWFREKRNLFCYSAYLFIVYNSKTWCITRSYTFFLVFSSL